MPAVVVSKTAVDELDRLIAANALPADTRERIRQRLDPLARFPSMGAALTGRWNGFRFLVGPWTWMIVVYRIVEPDTVVVTSIQDARRSDAATGSP